MLVTIRALGTLPEDARAELSGFQKSHDRPMVVLRGCVVDQPALLGLLERLRRAGLRICDVEHATRLPASEPTGSTTAVARLELTGRVGDLLRLTLGETCLFESPATTTAEFALRDEDELRELVARVERLALEIRSLHIRRCGTIGQDSGE